MEWAGSVACMRNSYNIIVGKSERKRQLGRRMKRLEDNIKMELKVIW
jgi:hypothetical protein